MDGNFQFLFRRNRKLDGVKERNSMDEGAVNLHGLATGYLLRQRVRIHTVSRLRLPPYEQLQKPS